MTRNAARGTARTAVLAFLGLLAPLAPAGAAGTYTYTVHHPSYGDIGTYTDIVSESDGVTRIDSRLRVAVTMLGVVVYREDGDRSEIWRDNRLVSFQSVSNRNGKRIEVRGSAEKDGFVVTTPAGTFVAPANVKPSDPWAIKELGAAVMVSTKSGKIWDVAVSGGEEATVSAEGKAVETHHFHVVAGSDEDKWEVWFDRAGVPVRFQSIESGELIDFILASPPGASTAAAEPAPAEAHAALDAVNAETAGDAAGGDLWNARTSAPSR